LGTSTTTSRCVIIGAGIAGMLAARVLADFFREVVLVEKDQLPQCPRARNGVPQNGHLHLMLARGWAGLRSLLPELMPTLAAAGCPEVDLGRDIGYLLHSGWLPPVDLEVSSRAASRSLIEYAIRSLVCQELSLTFVRGQVDGLLAAADGRSIRGVRIRGPLEREEIHADLVVDASGRRSQAHRWFGHLGVPLPEPWIVDSKTTYATRWFRIRHGDDLERKMLVLLSRPPHLPRGGMLQRVEGDYWVATFGAFAGASPPRNGADFLHFARSLAAPSLWAILREAEPASEVSLFRDLAGIHRKYHEARTWPHGFLAVGDAACALNPIYGQGMASAVVGSELLASCIRSYTKRGIAAAERAGALQRLIMSAYAQPWLLSTTEDFRWPTTTGRKRQWLVRSQQRFIDHVFDLAPRDPDVAARLLRVMHLVAPPSHLACRRTLAEFPARLIKGDVFTPQVVPSDAAS
jgi:2-polyprenyl-6-methoxyphenol hydroxylase-like FAD-dependent oxidoreductase